MSCPYCKSENLPGAVKCAACGSWMKPRPPVREWYRASEGRMVAGVCRGLANRFDVSVAAIRVAFILSAFFWLGFGLVAYVALWIAMPAPLARELARTAQAPAPPASTRPEDAPPRSW